MTDATPYTVPKEPGRWRAITLAALVHLALLAFLWIGIRWQSETPVTVEAEVWSPQIREAAPQPQPAPEPEPKPVVKETPKPEVPEPPAVKPEPPVEKQPDIALEQEKKRKAEEKRLEEERLAKKKEEEEKLARLKKEEEERLKKKKEEEEQLAKKKAEEKLRAEKEALAKKAAEEKKRKEQEEAEERMLAKAREEEMRRITGGVTGSGGTGDAPKSQGPRGDPSYGQRVAAKIKSNISFSGGETVPGNPAVEFEVKLLPDGSVAGIRKIKSSGVPGFDEAVSRAIEKSAPFPKDKSGSVPPSFNGIHRLKDQ